jgi:hypothetical protein
MIGTYTMAKLRKLIVSRRDPKSMELKKVAEFTLDKDGKVQAKYRNYRFMDDVEDGIRVGGRKYTPKDGLKFMHALQLAYARSTLFSVKAS